MLKMPQVKNRAKVPKEAVRVQAKAVNHQVAEAEENPLEAAAKAAKAAKVLALAKAKATVKAVNLVQAKAEKAAMVTETGMAKATEKAKHPRTMEHQVKMQEMISKMLQKRLLKPLMVLANAVRVQTQKAKRNVKLQNNQKKMLRMP